MALGEILQARWVSPLRAIEIVGKASFEDWTGWQTSSPDHRKIAIKNLKLALASGAVQSYHVDASGFERAFDPISFDGWRVRIDIENDGCEIQPGPIEDMRIDAEALKSFLDKASHPLPSVHGDLEECARWFIERLSTDERRPLNKELEPAAKQRWPNLSGRSIKQARKLALDRMGVLPSALSGRPPKGKPTLSD